MNREPTQLDTGKSYRFVAKRPRSLESTFALEQLTELAEQFSAQRFWAWIVTIYGVDIDGETAQKLHEELGGGSFVNPPILLVDSAEINDHLAAYSKDERSVYVANELVDAALEDDEKARELLVALVEEFGHHVDVMLRYEFSSVKPGETLPDGTTFKGDAEYDEGAAFAHSAILLDYDQSTEAPFAKLIEGSKESPFIAKYESAHELVKRYADEAEIASDSQSDGLEHFGAGEPKVPPGMDPGHCFTHKTIERDAFSTLPAHLKFSEGDLARVYFGNWLRDFSQAIDPVLVHHEEHNSLGIARHTLTRIIDLLARSDDAFGDFPDFVVDEKKLGVYLPHEHIDNPNGYKNAKPIDPDFRGACRPAELVVHPTTGVKAFIEQSRDYVAQELAAARSAGRTLDGMRHLGQALHVLEDFYSHSNFLEIALRKVGFVVDPWVPVPSTGRIPLTTGSFGGLDTAATVILEIGEILQKTDPFQPGKRSKGQKILLILLEESNPKAARLYDRALHGMEDFKKEHPQWWAFLHATIGALKRFMKFVFGMLLRAIGNQIDEAQKAAQKPSTNPTHTQLAKDHYDHHFHTLAAELAVEAVRPVGLAMVRAWAGESGETPLEERESENRPVKSGDTLSRIASEHGLTWQELARFNWGTDRPRDINRKLYEVVGCREPHGVDDPVDELGNYRFSDDDHLRGTGSVLVPKKADERDVVQIALDLMRHPEDLDDMDDLVRRWGESHPAQIKTGQSREWLHDHAKEIIERGKEWSGDVPVPDKLLEWLGSLAE